MIILKTLGRMFDITKYVGDNYQINRTLTGMFDTAEVVIPIIPKDEFNGIDLSKKIPRMSLVEITTKLGKTQWYVEKSDISQENDTEYKHTLKLTEPKWITQDRPLPDYAITQPQVDVGGIYTTETSSVKKERIFGDTMGLSSFFDLSVSQVSNDTNVIQNRVVKITDEYNFNFSITFGRLNAPILVGTPHLNFLQFDVYAGSDIIHTAKFDNFGSALYPLIGTLSFDFSAIVSANKEIKVKWTMDSLEGNWLNIKSGYLMIDRLEEKTAKPIYLDEVVDKLLNMVNVSDNPEFKLDDISRARLTTILAFDDLHTEATLYSGLERIASFIKARLYVDIIENFKVVRFEFYEDMAKQTFVEPITIDYEVSAPSNDYLSGVALENNNVIRENILIEMGSVRSLDDRESQITTDNISFKTKFPIDRIKRLEVRGKRIPDASNNTILRIDEYLDITNNIREKPHYDTLDKLANYDNRLVNNQNNHLYFVRGNNSIYGMSVIGSQFQAWTPSNTNRAIYETMATILQRNRGDVVIKKFIDGGLNDDMNLEFMIEYYPMSQSNAFIFKDDQSGFEEKRIRRLNANDRVNNAEYLGEYARTKVNSIGGTIKSLKGNQIDPLMITTLGAISPNNERVVDITYIPYGDEIEFYITMVKDYVFQSYYIGIDSDRRLVHIPRDEYVKRIDKSLNVIYLGQNTKPENTSVIRPILFMSFLDNIGFLNKAPKTAVLEFDTKTITTNVDVGATGNTIEWYLEMQDNFSAGNKRVRSLDQDFFYQYGVAYSDLFGRVERVVVNYREDMQDTLQAKNNFPEGDLALGRINANFDYTVKKDAREQYALSLQTSILSEDEEVYVYNGIAKFNTMSRFTTNEIMLAILEYKPNRDDKYIDIAQIIPHTNNVRVFNEYFEVDLNQGGMGYAFYEKNSNELILAVVKNLNAGKHQVYYRAEQYRLQNNFSEHYNYQFNINDTQRVIDSVFATSFQAIYDFSILDSQEYNSNHTTIFQKFYDFNILDTQLINENFNKIMVKKYEFNILDTQSIIENFNEVVIKTYEFDIIDTQKINDNWNGGLIINYDFDILDTQKINDNTNSNIQVSYDFNVLDTQLINENFNEIIVKEYEFNILDIQKINNNANNNIEVVYDFNVLDTQKINDNWNSGLIINYEMSILDTQKINSNFNSNFNSNIEVVYNFDITDTQKIKNNINSGLIKDYIISILDTQKINSNFNSGLIRDYTMSILDTQKINNNYNAFMKKDYNINVDDIQRVINGGTVQRNYNYGILDTQRIINNIN